MPVFVIHKMQANIYSEKERSKVECVGAILINYIVLPVYTLTPVHRLSSITIYNLITEI